MLIKKDIKLSEYTTFAIGGVAKYFTEVGTKEELIGAIKFSKENKVPFFIIGGGSNILISDKNFDGLIIKLINNKIKIKDNTLVSDAGVIWDDLVKFSVENKLQGIECLSGIPGSVGGAIVGNIGAFGQEIKDTLKSVIALNTATLKFEEFNNEECNFEYRESIFKKIKNKGKYVVFEVTFSLNENGKINVTYESLKKYLEEKNIKSPSQNDIRNAVLTLRERNYTKPSEMGNAGSFFKNTIITKEKLENLLTKFPDMKYFEYKDKFKIATGWMVEKSGWKGKKMDNVEISPKHALVILNPKMKAKALEVSEIAEKIANDVFKMFGVKIEREVEYVNF